jgi:CheY-like chemotaxis protein
VIHRLPAAPQRILIVDGDFQTRAALALALQAAGYTTRVAANGLDALRVLRAWRPDLILLDLLMPGMDGWTFRTRQLLDPRLAGIPVVVLSDSGDSARSEATRLGVAHCFAKPSGTEILDFLGELFDIVDAGAVP